MLGGNLLPVFEAQHGFERDSLPRLPIGDPPPDQQELWPCLPHSMQTPFRRSPIGTYEPAG